MREFQSFEEFWPFYVSEHSVAACRVLHYFGTSMAVVTLASLLATSRFGFIPLCLVLGYGPAWVGHFFIEKNKPASFKHPLWSLRGDFRMLGCALRGRMGAELERARAAGFVPAGA
jgi:hypothetical protein